MAGLVDPSGNQAASYFYCPTGNPADGPFGTAAAGNPFQYDSAYYDSSFQSYWMDGQQFDSNSGNAFSLNMSPDMLQATMMSAEQSGGDPGSGTSCALAIAGAVVGVAASVTLAAAFAPEAGAGLLVAGLGLTAASIGLEVYGAVSDIVDNPTIGAAAAQTGTIVVNHTVEPTADAFATAALEATGSALSEVASPVTAGVFGAAEAAGTCTGVIP